MTHVPCPAPGDALLPWAGAEPQQRRRGTPAGERPGDPPVPPPPAPGRWGGAGEVRVPSLAPGTWARPEHREGGIGGFACSHGTGENRERSVVTAELRVGALAEQEMCSPLGEGESCYFTGKENIEGGPGIVLCCSSREHGARLPCTMQAGVKPATQGPGAGENWLFWPPGPTAAPRHCRGCAAPRPSRCLCPAVGSPGRGDTEQGTEATADSSGGRGARPGESRPACSYLLSAWARPGNVRKINNKYLGNEAGAGAGWGLSRASEVAVAGGCWGCSRNSERCQLLVFPVWEETCHPEQLCAVTGVPAGQHRSGMVPGAGLSALRHTGAPMGTSCC